VVYLARDLELDRDVAIKVLARRRAEDSMGRRAFGEEARAMASVFHPNVVQVFSCGVERGLPYFAMEYLPNGTVAAYLEKTLKRGEQLNLDVVLGIARQVGNALQAVHDLGIVHRDVKPANMLIGDDFRVALADFGLVASLDTTSPTTGTLAGTPMYLAPELIRDNEVPEHHLHLCDIYSLGVSIYEMLCGTGPFDGESIREILGCHLNAAPAPVTDRRPDIPATFDAILARAMHKDPERRFSSCRELLLALRGAREAAVSREHPRSSRILVVDGDPQHQSVLAAALKVGFPNAAVVSAADAAEALGLVRTCRPDLVVLDMEVPAVSGLELCANLNADELLAGVPILALSPRPGATRALLRLLGATEIIPKPVQVRELVSQARRHLSGCQDEYEQALTLG
jgi:serine/threonine-protein kinase